MIGVNYTKLMSVLTTVCKQKMPIVIFLKNGAIIKSLSNVGVFETDNGLDFDDEGFLEYYACCVAVSEIIKDGVDTSIGEYIELSEYNEPERIETENGEVLWEKTR